MTTTFPLYDSLVKDIPNKKLLVKQKNELKQNISSFDTSGAELVYTLVRFYAKSQEEDEKYPYDSIEDTNKITFDIDKLPPKLQQILLKFSRMHIENMKEENSRPNGF